MCAHLSSSVLKIYHSSGTFDKHLVWQINQGLPRILPQCSLEVVLAVWLLSYVYSWVYVYIYFILRGWIKGFKSSVTSILFDFGSYITVVG